MSEYEQFITIVEQKAKLSRDEAEAAARATLQTLAERISAGQARDLAEQLPRARALARHVRRRGAV